MQGGETLVFEFNNEQPIYIQLVEQLKIHIISGRLGSGERLPSVRELAFMTKVNPNTMQKALFELEETGLIFTERTNGKFVTTDTFLIERLRQEYANGLTEKYIKNMADIGIDRKTAEEYFITSGGND